jgi:predicted NACHT family NTPase
MGKSTLMERLTLYMTRRSLGVSDNGIPGHERIGPPLIPILLRLGEFALASEELPGLKLEQHLINVLAKFDIAGLDTFMIEQCLKKGRCLVLFDGLDEVSKPGTREQVQVAIKEFIRFYRNTPKESNRFIITSRIAGYDQDAFPTYAHFTVAELTPKQIDNFLPRWCKANVRRSLRGSIGDANGAEHKEISKEANQRVADLRNAIQGHKAVQELAENPLLLTLLAVMQQNSIVLRLFFFPAPHLPGILCRSQCAQ